MPKFHQPASGMKSRHKMSGKGSRKSFSKHANKTHRKNLGAPRSMPMRGGIRL